MYHKKIAIDFLTDITPAPNGLLEYYRDFRLNEKELVFLLQLIRLSRMNQPLTFALMEEHTPFQSGEIKQYAAALVDKGFLTIAPEDCSMSLDGLFDKLCEVWGWKMKKCLDQDAKEQESLSLDKSFGEIYEAVQNEMGRPLSPIEGETVKDWFYGLKMPAPLIYEALKRSVMIGKCNFAYINQILLDWQKKQYKAVEDIQKQDKNGKKKNGDNFKTYQKDNKALDIYEV